MKKEAQETVADEMKESAAAQKAEKKAGTEKHRGVAMKAMKLFQKGNK